MKRIINPINLLLLGVSVAIIGFYGVTVIYYPKLYIICTYEDLYGEWAQTYGFLTLFAFSALLSFNKNQPKHWFYCLLAFISFYAFMEEISWGQRLFGFETPDFFHKNNYQNEANLHNLFTGPVTSLSKTLFTYLISICLLIYGVVLPIALQFKLKAVVWLTQKNLLVTPPLALIPAFITAAFLELEPFSFNEAEIAELLVAWALAFTALKTWLHTKNTQNQSCLPYLCIFMMGIGAAWGTTTLLLNNPEQRKEIDDRLANGYEKFAERYEGYDYKLGVIEALYQYDLIKPNNTVVLRKIADNYEMLGETTKAKLFLNKAIDEGLRRLKNDENNIQANVSLAKSYRKLGNYNAMSLYAEKAYQAASAKQHAEPKNAYWAYWLAKACEQTNRPKEALIYYREAYHLEPESSRYAEAYQQIQELMINHEH